MNEQLYVVRLYDGFDNEWIDLCRPCPKAEAEALWSEKTKGGTEKTRYEDIDYFAIFSADTKMTYSSPEAQWQEW